jgi:hypothetical protein
MAREMRNPRLSLRLKVGLAAGAVILVGFFAGIGWIVWWVSDNVGAPGPPPTGTGPCGSGDSVNLQLVYADGHTVHACTRDRPTCSNHPDTGFGNGKFTLSNQLRSSSRRYILFIGFDAALAAEAPEQTLQVGGYVDLPGTGPANGPLSAAIVQVTPRDPYEDGFTATSGSLAVSASHGVARGRIDAGFVTGPPRPDRPAPTPTTVSPVQITGTFACNHS